MSIKLTHRATVLLFILCGFLTQVSYSQVNIAPNGNFHLEHPDIYFSDDIPTFTNKTFYALPNGSGPIANFPAMGIRNQGSGQRTGDRNAYYTTSLGDAYSNVFPFEPLYTQEGSSIIVRQYVSYSGRRPNSSTHVMYDNYNYNTFNISVEVPEFINTENIENICNTQAPINIATYFKPTITGVIFYIDGLIANQIDPAALALGTHTLTAKKSYQNGQFSADFSFNIIEKPSAIVTPDGATDICEGTTLKLSAPVSPTGITYSYLWSSGQTSREILVTAAGNYSVTVSNGACSTTSPTLAVTTKPAPGDDITVTGTTDICEGSSAVLTAENAASYLWYKNGTILTGETGQSLVVSEAGSYNAVLSGSNGCKTTTSQTVITVKPNPRPTIAITGNIDFCDGGSVTLTAQSTGVPTNYTWSNGQTGQTIIVTTPGVYTVTATNPGGCQAVSTGVSITVKPNPIPTITPSGSTNLCQGTSVSLTASQANSYLWNTGQTTQTISVSTPGNYWVKVINPSDCEATSAVTPVIVKPNPLATISANRSTTLCAGETVTLNSSPGDSYVWSTGETTQSISVGQAGDYRVTVTKDGCSTVSEIKTVTVNIPITPTITPNGNLSPCFGEVITLTASDAVSYLWSNGQTSKEIQVTQSGIYTVTTKDINGCSATSASVNVNYKAQFSPVITANGSTTICNGSEVTLTASNGASYLWSNGATTQSFVASTPGNYTCVVTNAAGCSVETPPINVVVLNRPAPFVAASGLKTFCEGGSVVLTVTNPEAGATYFWSNGQAGQSITVSTSGIYTVNATYANSCSAISQPTIINVLPIVKPTVSASGVLTFCDGGSVVLTINEVGDNYTWSDGVTGKSRTVTSSGTYIATITNANGCSQSSDPVTVTVNPKPKPTIAITGQSTFCNGSSATLNVNNPVSNATYTWSNGQTGNNIVVSSAGNYFVSATYQNGCSEISDPVAISVLPVVKPTVTASGSLSFCSGGTVTLTINETGDTYTWSDGVTGKSRNVTAPGNYIATITNANGCSLSSDPVVITVLPTPKPLISLSKPSPFCEGETTTAYITNPVTGANYTWSNGQTGTTATLSTTGNFTVYASYANGCSTVSDPVNIVVNALPKPTISASNTTELCEGNSLTLTINETAAAYRWSNGETTKSIVVSAAGSYIGYTSNNAGCERASDPVMVTVKDNKIASISIFGKTEFCEGESVILTASQGASWRWSNGETTRSITIGSTGIYSVEITNASGCVSNSADISIKVNPIPKPVIAVSGATTICQGDNVTLTCSQVGTSYRWSNGETTKSITTSTAGSYTVYITNAQGCERASEPVEIFVKPNTKQVITASGATTFCQGESVTLSAPLIAGYNYAWSNGETGNSITVTTSGNYFVSITNALGCVSIADPIPVTVYPIPKPTIQIIGNTDLCEPETVTLTIKETGASYRWSNGETTKSITLNSSQTVTAFIINAQGCERESEPVTITVKPNALPVIVASGNTTICEGESVTLSVQNIAGQVYTWSNNQTGNSIVVTNAGEYYVKVRNTAGCERISAIMKVVVNPIPKPTIQIEGNTDLCEPETVKLTIKETGTAYRWSTGETTKSITVNSSQTVIGYIINDQGCERESEPVTVTVKPNLLPIVTKSGATTFCAGGSVTLSVPLVPGQNYKWSSGETTNSLIVSTPGSYFITVTNVNGCSRSSEVIPVTVLANPKPVISLDKPAVICEDDIITLTASPAASYYWPGTGYTTQSIQVTKSGTFTVETINDLGCKNVSDPVTITVNKRDKAIITASGVTTFCEGNSIILKANPGQKGYLWSTGEITEQITVTKTGTYSVTITNQAGCTSVSENVPVKVLDKPKPTITPLGVTEFCAGGSVVLKANEGKYFLWSNGEKSEQITVTKTGTFTVSITNESGCSETSAPITVTVNEPTALTKIEDMQACINGGIVTLNSEFPKGGKYTGTAITENKFNPLVAGVGQHTITYTYINANGCQSKITFVIEVTPVTDIVPGQDLTVCENENPVLLAIPTVPAGTVITGTGVQSNKFYPAVAGIGTHVITYVFKNAYGCTSTAQRSITVTAVPDVVTVTGVMEGCNNDIIRLTANSNIKGGGALTFNWYKAGELNPFYTGRILDYKITQNESIFVSANSAGIISCASTQTEVKITSLNPTGDFVANATKIPLGGLVKFTSSTVGAVRYLWEFGDGGKSTDKDPVHYYYKAGGYTVTMYAYSQTGCPLVVKRSSYIVVDADPIIINPPGNETDPVIQDKGYTNTVIYPNPIRNGQAKLRIFNKENKSSDVIVEFYTVSGRLLSQTTYGAQPGQNEIELKKLALLSASTYYLVRVQMNNQNFTFKILIL